MEFGLLSLPFCNRIHDNWNNDIFMFQVQLIDRVDFKEALEPVTIVLVWFSYFLFICLLFVPQVRDV